MQEHMRIDNDGEVLIGTTTPTGAKLLVDHNNTKMLELKRSGNTKARFLADSNHGQLDLYNSATVNTIRLLASGNSYLNGGNVGIGTTSPTRPLSVYRSTGGSVANFLHYTDASNFAGLYIDVDQATDKVKLTSSGNAPGGFSFNTATDERLTISTAGNIGIGDQHLTINLM